MKENTVTALIDHQDVVNQRICLLNRMNDLIDGTKMTGSVIDGVDIYGKYEC
jgi:phosphate transport system ATP-binding protein